MGIKKNKYRIIYCFLDSNGFIETREDSSEIFYCEIIEAKNEFDAVANLKAKEKFKSEVEIVEIGEIKYEQN